ncbi:MAG: hypothetical protein KDA20_00600 [Phycisphaerales bacterium]|nr:hypothetical protein [Phycisphaerales bacterium]
MKSVKCCIGAATVAALSAVAMGQDYNGGAYCPILGPGPDVTLCEAYGFGSTGRVNGGNLSGAATGFTLGTTSWNVGQAQLLWEQMPDPDHPKITVQVYRLKDGRFENIANHWIKHGFFALSSQQCSDAALSNCQGTNGTRLGLACTDTYSPGLNAGSLGPRYEVNPWSGAWSYTGSIHQTGGRPNYTGATNMQLPDADVNPALNPGARYFFEAYYVSGDDICVYNNASYKEFFVNSFGGSGPSVSEESDRFTPPHQMFAILDAWTGATLTEIAEQIPVVEGVSPDGRAIVGCNVTDLGGGQWRYDYTIMNVDMDRQIDQFWIDLRPNVNVTDLYFHAPLSHEETLTYEFSNASQGPPRDNDAWTGVVETDKVRWFTDAHQAGVSSNPIGWGTAYSFGFTADTAPKSGSMGVTAYKDGTVIAGATPTPDAGAAPNCPGDTNGDNVVDLTDLNNVLFNFGSAGPLGDVDGSGLVDLTDLNLVLFNFGNVC